MTSRWGNLVDTLPDMNKQSGLTLLELIIVVVIVGIMAAIAVPNFGNIMRGSQLKTSYNNFVGMIATARSEAINRSSTITACVSTDQTACVANGGGIWSDGYMIFVDANRNGTREVAEEILKYEPPIGSGITITSPADYQTSISIAARGRLQNEGTFVFCDGTNTDTARALNLWVTGLGRLATDSPADADTIVEGADGNNVVCN